VKKTIEKPIFDDLKGVLLTKYYEAHRFAEL
jgi:hypothetical protein